VGGEAVELGDQALLGQEAVDLLAVDPSVDVRPGESVGVEKGEEPELELALGDAAADVAGGEQPLDGGRPRAGRVPRDEVGEGGRAAEALDLRLRRRPLEVVVRDDRGEVQERAGGW
jgi:hypothetical protein